MFNFSSELYNLKTMGRYIQRKRLIFQNFFCVFFRWNIWFVPALSTSYFQCKFAFFDSFLGKPSKYQKDSDVEALFYKVHEITEILSLSSSWSSLPIDGKKYVQWDPLWKIISASILCHLRQKKKYFANTLIDVARWWFGTKLVLFNFFESLKIKGIF